MTTLSILIPRYKKRLERVMREPIVATATKVAVRSPVDSGLFRRSWTPALNRLDNSNKGGNAESVANQMKIGDSFSYVNGQPYGPRLEYESWSKQAPSGMVRISAAEWAAEVRKAAKNGS